MPINNLARFIAQLLEIYTLIVFANALLSWFVHGYPKFRYQANLLVYRTHRRSRPKPDS